MSCSRPSKLMISAAAWEVPSARVIRLTVVRGPLDEISIDEAPRALLRVYFQQHVGVWIVACGRHDIVLRTILAGMVDPLVQVTGHHQLNGACVFAQQRVQTVIAEFGGRN